MLSCDLCKHENLNVFQFCEKCGSPLVVKEENNNKMDETNIDEKIMYEDVELYPPTNERRHKRQDYTEIIRTPAGRIIEKDEIEKFMENTGDDVNRVPFVLNFNGSDAFKGMTRLYWQLGKINIAIFIVYYLFVISIIRLSGIEFNYENFINFIIILSFIPLGIIMLINWNHNLGFDLNILNINDQSGRKDIKNLGIILLQFIPLSGFYYGLYLLRKIAIDNLSDTFTLVGLFVLAMIFSYFILAKLSMVPGLIVNKRTLIGAINESLNITNDRLKSIIYVHGLVFLISTGLYRGIEYILGLAYVYITIPNIDFFLIYLTYPLYILMYSSFYLLHQEVSSNIINGKVWSPIQK